MSDVEKAPGLVAAEAIARALAADVPKLYCTNFSFAMNHADVTLAFELDNKPVVVLHLSHGLAKDLAAKTGERISFVEKKIGHKFSTPGELNELMAKAIKDKNEQSPDSTEG